MDALFELKKITYWHGFGTVSLPHTDTMENMMCLFEGYKNITLVSPYDRKFVYAGNNDLPSNYSPVEFVNTDYTKWPLFRYGRVKTVQILPGDCLYIPAYWWN